MFQLNRATFIPPSSYFRDKNILCLMRWLLLRDGFSKFCSSVECIPATIKNAILKCELFTFHLPKFELSAHNNHCMILSATGTWLAGIPIYCSPTENTNTLKTKVSIQVKKTFTCVEISECRKK